LKEKFKSVNQPTQDIVHGSIKAAYQKS